MCDYIYICLCINVPFSCNSIQGIYEGSLYTHIFVIGVPSDVCVFFCLFIKYAIVQLIFLEFFFPDNRVCLEKNAERKMEYSFIFNNNVYVEMLCVFDVYTYVCLYVHMYVRACVYIYIFSSFSIINNHQN